MMHDSRASATPEEKGNDDITTTRASLSSVGSDELHYDLEEGQTKPLLRRRRRIKERQQTGGTRNQFMFTTTDKEELRIAVNEIRSCWVFYVFGAVAWLCVLSDWWWWESDDPVGMFDLVYWVNMICGGAICLLLPLLSTTELLIDSDIFVAKVSLCCCVLRRKTVKRSDIVKIEVGQFQAGVSRAYYFRLYFVQVELVDGQKVFLDLGKLFREREDAEWLQAEIAAFLGDFEMEDESGDEISFESHILGFLSTSATRLKVARARQSKTVVGSLTATNT